MDDEETKGSRLRRLEASPNANFQEWSFGLEMVAMSKMVGTGEAAMSLWEAINPAAGKAVPKAAQDSAFGLIGRYVESSLYETISTARQTAQSVVPPQNIAQAAFKALQRKFQGTAEAQANQLSAEWKCFKHVQGDTVMRTFQRFRELHKRLENIGSRYSAADVWQTITGAFAQTKFQSYCDAANVNVLMHGMKIPELVSLESALTAKEQELLKGAPKTSSPALVTAAEEVAHGGGRGRSFGRSSGGRGGRSFTRGGGRSGGRGSGQTQQSLCWGCGKAGHKKADCPENADKGGRHGGAGGSSFAALVTIGSPALASGAKADPDPNVWAWDSCSVQHITPYRDNLCDVRKLEPPVSISLGAGEQHVASEMGTAVLRTVVDGKSSEIRLKEVLIVPKFKHQLIGTRGMHQPAIKSKVVDVEVGGILHQYWTIGEKKVAVAVWNEGDLPKMKATAVRSAVQPTVLITGLAHLNKADVKDAWELHDSTGHPSHRLLADGISKELVTGTNVKASVVRQLGSCGACFEGKMVRQPFKAEAARKGSWGTAECIHVDYWGPARVSTPEGYDGFIAMTDAATHMRIVVLLQGKSNEVVLPAFHNMLGLLRNQGKEASRVVKALRIDGGRETLTGALKDWCSMNGVQPEVTAAHSSQQNGIAESTNRLLLERVRVQLAASKLPTRMWGHVLQASVMQLNRLPCSSNPGGVSPWQMYTGEVPSLARFKPLGSVAYVLKLPRYKTGAGKLGPVSERGRLVGYGVNSATWVFLLDGGSVVHSRDFRWIKGKRVTWCDEEDEDDDGGSDRGLATAGEGGQLPAADALEPTADAQNAAAVGATGEREGDPAVGEIPSLVEDDSDESEDEEPQRRVSARSNKGKAPDRLSLVTVASDIPEPKSWEEAMAGTYAGMWKDSAALELQSLKDNGVMTPVGRVPPGVKVIDTRMVLKVKANADGTLDKLKSRLVAKGYEQRASEVGQTYAPTGSLDIMRAALAHAARNGLDVQHMDFTTAFLQAPIPAGQEVYISLPYFCGEPGVAYKLNRALYGLKQSPRAWYDTLRAGLADISLLAADSDSALFVRRGKTAADNVLIFCHVDDVLVIGQTAPVASVKQQLGARFKVKDLGPASFMLDGDHP